MRGRDVDRDAESVRTPEGLKSRRLRDAVHIACRHIWL